MKSADEQQTASSGLSRRERQILDVIYRQEQATVADVQEGLPDKPSYSAVRGLLSIMEKKGLILHGKQGARYVYTAARPRQAAARSAIKDMLSTFFGGSVEKAVSTLLTMPDLEVSDEELDSLSRLIAEAKESESRP